MPPALKTKPTTKHIPPDVTKPKGWLQHHRTHGKPFYEVRIGEWHRWRCTCGERFHFSNADKKANPNDYVLGER